jgi:PAS domain S-box-containing protein
MEPRKKPGRSGTTGETAAHRRAEEMRAQLAAIVDSSEDAIISKDLNGIILSWNRGAERMFGYRADEIVGLPVGRLLPPDRIAEDDEVAGRLRSGEHVQTRETVRVAKDGRRIEVSATFSPVRDPGGALVGISNILRDIAARKQSERALRESEERLRSVLQSSAVGTFEFDLETGEGRWNEVEYALLGLKPFSVTSIRATWGC